MFGVRIDGVCGNGWEGEAKGTCGVVIEMRSRSACLLACKRRNQEEETMIVGIWHSALIALAIA